MIALGWHGNSFRWRLLALALGGSLLAASPAWAAKKSDEPAKTPESGSRYSVGSTDKDIIAFIDAQVRKTWEESAISPSTKASDSEWCRRAYLDLLGRVPKVAELKAYLASSPGDRKARLLDKLLESDDYTEQYAANWTTYWTNLLIGRPPARRNRRDMTNREGMQQYLRQSFLHNKPYDKMVYELVSATGNTTPGQDNYNGATNFLVGKLQENATEATSKTAKYFLGMQVQCTQCHNHPFNEWKQDQFWSLNAFFRQTKARPARAGRQIESTQLENEDFRGEGSTPKEAEIYFEKRNGELQVAYPTFVDGTKIDPSGYVKDVDRRAQLADLIVKSDYLGQAIVNRYWSYFLGYGFTKPIDDIGPHNTPSHPELIERLGKEFAVGGHDLKRLIRWIMLSEAYSLSSKTTTKNAKDDPTLGERPKFSHFYLRQMQAEQLYESVLAIIYEHAPPGSADEREGRKADELRQFTLTFGNDEGDDATTFNGTIPQVLMLMNGQMVKSALDTKRGSFLFRLANNFRPREAIDILFLSALSRPPTGDDMKPINWIMSSRGPYLLSGYQDILWALLNSNEFIFIH
jgi:uncharacterized protein DUF1549/uncharacterized protein DUF1553